MSDSQVVSGPGEDKSVHSRLREMREFLGLTQAELARALDVSSKTVGRWENGLAIPSNKLTALERLGIDVVYVMTGQHLSVYQMAQRVQEENWAHVRDGPPPLYGLDPEHDQNELELLDCFRASTPEGQEAILGVARALRDTTGQHNQNEEDV